MLPQTVRINWGQTENQELDQRMAQRSRNHYLLSPVNAGAEYEPSGVLLRAFKGVPEHKQEGQDLVRLRLVQVDKSDKQERQHPLE